MTDNFKYIKFVKVEQKPKTSVWECKNNRSGDVLGKVGWYGPWRQYCYFPEPYIEAVYSVGCLDDIEQFIKRLKEAREEAHDED